MKRKCYVGFDTSNYTTSIAVCTEEGEIALNLRQLLPVKEGACGLRQSDAVFAHIKNLPDLCDALRQFLRENEMEIAAVGVSRSPRTAADSYMPCFLSGIAVAHAFAAAADAPVWEFSHQDGHIMAAAYSSGEQERLLSAPFYAWHISGGTTEALLVEPHDAGFSVQCVGGSRDLHAGQVIDRVGVMLGLSFPCGVALEKLAADYAGKPTRAVISVQGGYCNLSGLENLARKLYEDHGNTQECAAFVFDFLCRTILRMCENLGAEHGARPFLFAGGVMSNRLMRGTLASALDASFADPQFSADNAAGIALLCRRAAENGGMK